MKIYDIDQNLISKHPLLGFDKKYFGADFNLLLEPKSEKFGE